MNEQNVNRIYHGKYLQLPIPNKRTQKLLRVNSDLAGFRPSEPHRPQAAMTPASVTAASDRTPDLRPSCCRGPVTAAAEESDFCSTPRVERSYHRNIKTPKTEGRRNPWICNIEVNKFEKSGSIYSARYCTHQKKKIASGLIIFEKVNIKLKMNITNTQMLHNTTQTRDHSFSPQIQRVDYSATTQNLQTTFT